MTKTWLGSGLVLLLFWTVRVVAVNPDYADIEVKTLTSLVEKPSVLDKSKLFQGQPANNLFLRLPAAQDGANAPFYRCFWSSDGGSTFDQVPPDRCTEKNGMLQISCGISKSPIRFYPASVEGAAALSTRFSKAVFHPASARALDFQNLFSYVDGGETQYVVAADLSYPYRMGQQSTAILKNKFHLLFAGPEGSVRRLRATHIGYRDEQDCSDCNVFFVPPRGKFYIGGIMSAFFPGNPPPPERPYDGIEYNIPKKIKLQTYDDSNSLAMSLERLNGKNTPPLSADELTALVTKVGPDLVRALTPPPSADPCESVRGVDDDAGKHGQH